jgi:hypothetical protein
MRSFHIFAFTELLWLVGVSWFDSLSADFNEKSPFDVLSHTHQSSCPLLHLGIFLIATTITSSKRSFSLSSLIPTFLVLVQ